MSNNAKTKKDTNTPVECNRRYAMKTRGFFCALMLLSLSFCFSSEANAFQTTSSIVTVYTEPDFKGNEKHYDIGNYRLLPGDFNDVISSIRVPAGMVVVVYEDGVDAGGYGRWIDFLEDQPSMAKYGLDEQISYLQIFRKRNPDGSSWVRNSLINGKFIQGGWFKPRVSGEKAPFNSAEAVSAPPKAAPGSNTTSQPKPTPEPKPTPQLTVCTISGHVTGDKAVYGTHINLFVPGERKPRVSVSVTNGQYTIPNVPEGSYEVRGKLDNPMTQQTPRGPIGLIAVSDDDQRVTCEKGQPITVNFKIVSSEG